MRVRPPFGLVVGDAYGVYPFEDLCVMRPVTGTMLWEMLEASVFDEPSPNNGFLQIAGFTFTYQLSAPAGARVQSVTLDDGTAIARVDPIALMLVDNDYIDRGGDDYGMLIQTPPAPGRDTAAEVLLTYVRSQAQLATPAGGRITHANTVGLRALPATTPTENRAKVSPDVRPGHPP